MVQFLASKALVSEMYNATGMESKLNPKYDILLYVVIIILWGKIKITTSYKITHFGFYFDWKST